MPTASSRCSPRSMRLVHDQVHAFGGSISAEHGVGQLKRGEIARYKSAVELQLMRALKQALDPLGIMNPGKMLCPRSRRLESQLRGRSIHPFFGRPRLARTSTIRANRLAPAKRHHGRTSWQERLSSFCTVVLAVLAVQSAIAQERDRDRRLRPGAQAGRRPRCEADQCAVVRCAEGRRALSLPGQPHVEHPGSGHARRRQPLRTDGHQQRCKRATLNGQIDVAHAVLNGERRALGRPNFAIPAPTISCIVYAAADPAAHRGDAAAVDVSAICAIANLPAHSG